MNRDDVASPRLLIVGCGYVGKAIAQQATHSGYSVFALTRSESRFDELRAVGVQPVQAHWQQPRSLSNLPSVDHVIVAVPHRVDEVSGSADSPELTHVRGLNNLLSNLPASWHKLIYLSTTGVYGQDSAVAVNEDTPVSPTRIGPQIAVAAEDWLAQHVESGRATVLRLAGIYGPGRVPLAEKIRAGEPLAVPRYGYLNLIHVTDIARVIMLMLERRMQRPAYVFSDGKPIEREVFYRYLADICGVKEPTFAVPEPTDAKTRRATDKRIDPSRLVRELGFEYLFSDFCAGLADAIRS